MNKLTNYNKEYEIFPSTCFDDIEKYVGKVVWVVLDEDCGQKLPYPYRISWHDKELSYELRPLNQKEAAMFGCVWDFPFDMGKFCLYPICVGNGKYTFGNGYDEEIHCSPSYTYVKTLADEIAENYKESVRKEKENNQKFEYSIEEAKVALSEKYGIPVDQIKISF